VIEAAAGRGGFDGGDGVTRGIINGSRVRGEFGRAGDDINPCFDGDLLQVLIIGGEHDEIERSGVTGEARCIDRP